MMRRQQRDSRAHDESWLFRRNRNEQRKANPKEKLNKNTMKQDSSDITETLQTHLTEMKEQKAYIKQ